MRELSRQEPSEALGSPIAQTAHELNNLLIVIRGHSALIAQGPHATELAPDLAAIDQAVARAAVLMRQLRALSRLPGSVEPATYTQVLRGASASL